MITVKVHNDGEEKHQSFEAWVNGIDCERGYGATKQEAIADYKRELKNYTERLAVIRQDLELGNIETVDVDFCGNPI